MEYLTPTKDMWGLDVEGDGFTPTKLWCVCLVNLVSKEQLYFTEAEPFREWLSTDAGRIFVGHNILKADVPWLFKLWKARVPSDRCIDTFVLSCLFNPKLPKPEDAPADVGTHSLAAYGYRFKDKKHEFNDFSKFTDEMLTYCFQDVKLTLKVYKSLSAKLKRLGFSEQCVKLEHDVVPIIAQQQENGFEFDILGARDLRDQLRRDQLKLEEHIHEVFKPELVGVGRYKLRLNKDGQQHSTYRKHTQKFPEVRVYEDGTYECFEWSSFNIGSPSQRLDRLLKAGYKPTKFTKLGNAQIDEDSLVEYAKLSGKPEIQMIADWLVLEGRANMIQTWIDNLGPDYRIHGNVFTCGANSRRMKHSAPNTANIPRVTTKYGREVRSLWIARRNRVLVGVDAAALEGRMFYHHLCNYVQDLDIRAFVYSQVVDGKPHKLNAQALTDAGIPCTYEDAKTEYFARVYGAGDAKLGAILKGDAALGKRIREVLDRTIPGFEKLLKAIAKEFKQTGGLLKCIDGGFVRCYSEGSALNYKLQPDGAIFMKQALVFADKMLREAGMDYMFCGNVHDEWQLDVLPDHAEQVGKICCEAMKLAGEYFNLHCPMAGEFKVGNSWSATH